MIELTQLQVDVVAKGIDKTNEGLEKLVVNSDKAEQSATKLKGTLTTLDTINKMVAGTYKILAIQLNDLSLAMKANEGTFKAVADSAQKYASAMAIIDKAAAQNLLMTEKVIAARAKSMAAEERAYGVIANTQRIEDNLATSRAVNSSRLLTQKNLEVAAEERAYKAITQNEQVQRRANAATAQAAVVSKRKTDAQKLEEEQVRKLGNQQRFQLLTLQYTVNDVAASLASGANPLTILMQQGGQVSQAYGGIGAAVKGLPGTIMNALKPVVGFMLTLKGAVIAVAGSFLAYGANIIMASKQQREFNNEVFLSGNQLGYTYSQYREAASVLGSELNISLSEAKDRFDSFTEAGRFSGQEIVGLTEITSKWAKLSGKDFDDVQKKVADLAEEPLKLAMAIGTVDEETLKYISTLQVQGRQSEALRVAIVALNKELDEGTKQSTSASRGYLERYYEWVFGLFKSLGKVVSDFFHNWGRDATEGEKSLEAMTKVKALQADLVGLQTAKAAAERGGARFSKFQESQLRIAERQLAAEQENLRHLQRGISLKNAEAEAEKKANDQREYRVQLNDRYLKSGADIVGIEKAKTNAVARYTAELEKAGVKANDGSEAAKQILAFHEAEIKAIEKKAGVKKQELKDMSSLINSASMVIQNTRESIAESEKQTTAERKLVEVRHALADSEIRMSAVQREKLHLKEKELELVIREEESYRVAQKSIKQHEEAINAWVNAYESAITAGNQRIAQLDQSIAKEKAYAQGLHEVASATKRVALEEANRKLAEAQTKIAKENDPGKAGALQGLIDSLRKEIPKLQQELDLIIGREAIENVNNLADAISTGLGDAFGTVGKALGSVVKTMATYYTQQQEILAMQKEAQELQGADKAKKLADIQQKSSKSNLEMYANMTSSLKMFFKEGSKGYKALQKIEMAYKLASLALDAKKIASEAAMTAKSIAGAMSRGAAYALEAIAAGFASGPFTGIVIGAGVMALMASLGLFKGGGGGSFNTAEQNQEAAGKGTVFGDSDAKSESITKSLEIVAQNSEISSTYQRGMLKALISIEKALAGTAKQILKSGVNDSAEALAGQTGFQMNAVGKFFAGAEKFSPLGDPVGKFLGSLFGKKTTLLDTGIKGTGQTIAQILKDGFQGLSYANIETTKKRLFSKKTSVSQQTADLDTEVERQFTLVIQSLAQGVVEAGKLLGKGETEIMSVLNNMVIDFGEMSLKDLSGAQIQEQITTMFSKLGDEMAKAALPGFEQFQEIGEGYFETVMRVASSIATIDGIFSALGADLSKVFQATGMAAIEAKMSLIEMAGGLEALSEKVNFFFDKFYSGTEKIDIVTKQVTAAFAQLGVAMPTTRQGFRDLVNGLNLADEGQRTLYLALLELAPALDQILPPLGELSPAAQAAADRIKLLTEQLDALKASAQSALSGLERSVNAEKDALKSRLDAHITVLNAEKEVLKGTYDERKSAIEAEAASAQAAADTQVQAAEEAVAKAREAADALKGIFDALESGIVQLRGTVAEVVNTNYQAAKRDLVKMATAARAGQLPTADAISAVTSTLAGNTADNYASAQDFAREQLVAANYLEEIQGIAGKQMTEAERMAVALENAGAVARENAAATSAFYQSELDALDKQYNLSLAAIDAQIAAAQKQYDADVAYLDGILANAKKQLEIALGTYEATVSVGEALTKFNESLRLLLLKQAEVDQAKLEQKRAEEMASTSGAANGENQNTKVAVVLDEVATRITETNETIAAGNRAVAVNTLETAKILRRWDGDGQPDIRAE